MTLTPRQKEIEAAIIEVINDNWEFRRQLERNAAKVRFEKVNSKYLKLSGDE
jgi:hypothetical protein